MSLCKNLNNSIRNCIAPLKEKLKEDTGWLFSSIGATNAILFEDQMLCNFMHFSKMRHAHSLRKIEFSTLTPMETLLLCP